MLPRQQCPRAEQQLLCRFILSPRSKSEELGVRSVERIERLGCTTLVGAPSRPATLADAAWECRPRRVRPNVHAQLSSRVWSPTRPRLLLPANERAFCRRSRLYVDQNKTVLKQNVNMMFSRGWTLLHDLVADDVVETPKYICVLHRSQEGGLYDSVDRKLLLWLVLLELKQLGISRGHSPVFSTAL